MYTKLGELIDAIDADSIVEIIKESELITKNSTSEYKKWKDYIKTVKKDMLDEPVKILPQYGIRIVFIGK